MAASVALLRGINVGSRNRIDMAGLRAAVAELGYRDVRTHLQSGNVVFDAGRRSPRRTAAEIEGQIAARYGLDIGVLVRTARELDRIVRDNPLAELAADPARMLVTFLFEEPERAIVDALDPAAFEPEAFALRGRELYMWCPKGFQDSRIRPALSEKRLGVRTTFRNWNTVTRLAALARGE